MAIQKRLQKIEQAVYEEDGEPVSFPLGSGQQWRGTMEEFKRILYEVEGSRHYPPVSV